VVVEVSHFGAPRGRGGRPWDEEELLVVLRSLPRALRGGVQDYSPRHEFVIELADLLNRTPGAISLRLANFVFLKLGPGHGKSHVGASTRAVYDEYAGREKLVERRAEEARRAFAGRSLTPRVEVQVRTLSDVDDQAKTLRTELSRLQADPAEFLIYDRPGTDYVGLLTALAWTINNPDLVKSWLTTALELWKRLNPSKNVGAEDALGPRPDDLARKVLLRDVPGIHTEELGDQDVRKLASRILDLGPLGPWRLSRKRIDRMRREAVEIKSRVGRFFGIDPGRLCSFCAMKLLILAERAERQTRSRLS
jgi:hypothetical protein